MEQSSSKEVPSLHLFLPTPPLANLDSSMIDPLLLSGPCPQLADHVAYDAKPSMPTLEEPKSDLPLFAQPSQSIIDQIAAQPYLPIHPPETPRLQAIDPEPLPQSHTYPPLPEPIRRTPKIFPVSPYKPRIYKTHANPADPNIHSEAFEALNRNVESEHWKSVERGHLKQPCWGNMDISEASQLRRRVRERWYNAILKLKSDKQKSAQARWENKPIDPKFREKNKKWTTSPMAIFFKRTLRPKRKVRHQSTEQRRERMSNYKMTPSKLKEEVAMGDLEVEKEKLTYEDVMEAMWAHVPNLRFPMSPRFLEEQDESADIAKDDSFGLVG